MQLCADPISAMYLVPRFCCLLMTGSYSKGHNQTKFYSRVYGLSLKKQRSSGLLEICLKVTRIVNHLGSYKPSQRICTNFNLLHLIIETWGPKEPWFSEAVETLNHVHVLVR